MTEAGFKLSSLVEMERGASPILGIQSGIFEDVDEVLGWGVRLIMMIDNTRGHGLVSLSSESLNLSPVVEVSRRWASMVGRVVFVLLISSHPQRSMPGRLHLPGSTHNLEVPPSTSDDTRVASSPTVSGAAAGTAIPSSTTKKNKKKKKKSAVSNSDLSPSASDKQQQNPGDAPKRISPERLKMLH